jgi:hypothetical protein
LSAQTITPNREAAIWARLIQSQPKDLTPDTARYLLSLGFDESDRVRVQELADRAQAGVLAENESAEFDSYLHIGNLLAVMQSKARVVLANSRASRPKLCSIESFYRRLTGPRAPITSAHPRNAFRGGAE